MDKLPKTQNTSSTLSIPSFVDAILIKEVGQVARVAPYLAFSCIATGIETLGALLDVYPVEERDHSLERFKYAVEHLFSKSYHSHATRLYRGLRCPIVHRMQVDGVVLSHVGRNSEHLTMKDGNVVLALEPLMKDYTSACNELITRFTDGRASKSAELYSYVVIRNTWGLNSSNEPVVLLKSLTGS